MGLQPYHMKQLPLGKVRLVRTRRSNCLLSQQCDVTAILRVLVRDRARTELELAEPELEHDIPKDFKCAVFQLPVAD